jgi:hypothetical protein
MNGTLPISALRLDGGTQSRATISDSTVAEYTECLDALPPVVVFHDGSDHWLADGFHRVRAFMAAGRPSVPADVRQGTQRDAVLFSFGVNDDHGLRRTRAEARAAVVRCLSDEEWGARPDRWIADKCRVSPDTVNRVRKQLSESDGSVAERSAKPRVGRDGKTRALPVRRPAPAPVESEPPVDNWPSEPTTRVGSTPLPREYRFDDGSGSVIRPVPEASGGPEEWESEEEAHLVYEAIGAAWDRWPTGESTGPLEVVLRTWLGRIERRKAGAA